MFCKACGKQIDDDSKFCKECGAAQLSGLKAQTEESRFEYCRVEVGYGKSSWLDSSRNVKFFVAKGEGSNAGKVYGTSQEWTVRDEAKLIEVNGRRLSVYDAARMQLIAALERDGWQLVEGARYGNQYRRRVK